MKIHYVLIFNVFGLLVNGALSTHAHRGHGRTYPVCDLTSQNIQDTLVNPCTIGVFESVDHPMEPSNVCFIKNGRIITSLQAMLSTFNHTYSFNPQDLDLLFDTSVDLPTSLVSYTTSEYVNVLRVYYRELSCLWIKMNRADVSIHGRRRQRQLCSIVTRHVKPMLCVDTEEEVELETLPEDCSDWNSLPSSDVDVYGYWTIKYFEEFLSSLSPKCQVTLSV